MAKKIKTSNGRKGGLLEGKTHANGGIKAVVVTDNNRPVELEHGEVIITAPAVKKDWKKLDEINRAGGGVPIGPPQMKAGGKINPTTMESKTKDMRKSDIINVALQDVISLERYRNLDLAQAKVLFKINIKSLNEDDSWWYGDPTVLREEIYNSLYEMNYIALGDDHEYELSNEGTDFIKAVKGRIQTLENVQAGTDLFPEEANVDLHKPEDKTYVDIKSCLIEEGDEESTFIFEGKEFINKELGHNERWKIISFFKYGVNLEHVTMNKLTTKKANEKLTFDEMKKLQKEGLLEIVGINNETQLSHCLKILKKCIDNIDLNESHEAEKKAHEKTKIDNIKISSPPEIVGTKRLEVGDEGMWHGGERRIVDIDESGNAMLQEIGVDKPPIKVPMSQLEKEFALFPEEDPYVITDAIKTLEMLLEEEPDNKEWKKYLSELMGQPVAMASGGQIENDKEIFESQFGKQ